MIFRFPAGERGVYMSQFLIDMCHWPHIGLFCGQL